MTAARAGWVAPTEEESAAAEMEACVAARAAALAAAAAVQSPLDLAFTRSKR